MRASTRCWFLFLSLTLVIVGGCSQEKPRVKIEKTRPLPEVSAGDQNFSSYKPATAFEEIAPNALSRTVYQGTGPAGYRLEVRDIRLAPGKKAADLSLPGAGFAQVRSGSGTMTAGDKRQELPLGATWSISQGQHFSLDSTSDQPLIIRVQLLVAE